MMTGFGAYAAVIAPGCDRGYIRGMSSLAFDTHKFVKNLTKTGMKADQAEVLAETYADLLTDRLATKDDLKAQEERLTSLIERTQTRTILTVTGLLGFLILILEFYG